MGKYMGDQWGQKGFSELVTQIHVKAPVPAQQHSGELGGVRTKPWAVLWLHGGTLVMALSVHNTSTLQRLSMGMVHKAMHQSM